MLRAASLFGLLGDTLAATHLSAAWVHGALTEPPLRHTVQRAVERRLHHVLGRRIVYRDLRVDEDDLQAIGGVRVTCPVRTLADLSRIPDDEYADAARRMADLAPELSDAAIHWLQTHGALPHKRAALAFLRGLSARPQDEVTRYTS